MRNSFVKRPGTDPDAFTEEGAIKESDVKLHLQRALGMQADVSRPRTDDAGGGSGHHSQKPRPRRHRRQSTQASLTGNSSGSRSSSSSSGGSEGRASGSPGRHGRKREGNWSWRLTQLRAEAEGGGGGVPASADGSPTFEMWTRRATPRGDSTIREVCLLASGHHPDGADEPADVAAPTTTQKRSDSGAGREADPPTSFGGEEEGCFMADVYCTRVLVEWGSHAVEPTEQTTRFLFSRCHSVEALLDTLQSLSSFLKADRSSGCHPHTDPAAMAASAAPAEWGSVSLLAEGTAFVWIDLHGVPPPPPPPEQRPEGEGAAGEAGEGPTKGLSALWRFLKFAPRHVAQMQEVAESFYEGRRKARRSRRPNRGSVIAAARASGGLSAEGLRLASDGGFQSLLTSPSSSSSSSSGSSSEGEEEEVLHSLAVGDMYLEDLRMRVPDTVRVLKTQPESKGDKDQEGEEEDGVYYTVTELATLTQKAWTRFKARRHEDRRAARRASQYSIGAFDTRSFAEDQRFLIDDDAEAFLDVSVPVLPTPSPTEKAVSRCERADARASPSSSSSSSPSSSSSSASFSVSSDPRQGRGYGGSTGATQDPPPMITSTYFVAFPNVCLTWCPVSTHGKASRQPGRGEPVLSRGVKDWHRLQEAVVARMRGPARAARKGGSDRSPPPPQQQQPQPQRWSAVPTTAQFASLLLATVCYSYLPDTTAVLNEVDAIDAMLPLIVPDRESDQADALRRVLVLRRRLAIHRRLLYQKMRLLEELQRPAMRTLAAFMNGASPSGGGGSGGPPSGGGVALSSASALLVPPASAHATSELSSPFTTGTFAGTRAAIEQAARKLDSARTVLGNTTLIYSSAVTSRNFKASNETDFFQLSLQYLCLTVLPLTIVVSMWGMNCVVPWGEDPSLRPFFGIVGVLAALCVVGLAYPVYAMRTGRPELITAANEFVMETFRNSMSASNGGSANAVAVAAAVREESLAGEHELTPQFLSYLTAAAQAALTSVHRQEREAASDRLLFLSSFDHWESTTKRLLPYCRDNCLRFIVCKAMYFMVANELGPQERAEVKLYVLNYLKERHLAGEVLPVYVQRELFLVYSSALFSNWKIAVITEINNEGGKLGIDGSGSGGGGGDGGPSLTLFEIAAQMLAELSAFLEPEPMLDCLHEVIGYFFQHIVKAAIPSLKRAFVLTVLPCFFETATQRLSAVPQKAAEVCCAALECLGPLANSGGLLNVKYTSEPSIHILRWVDGWSTSLAVVMEYSCASLCADPTGEHARLMGRLVQLCSRVDSPHEQFMREGRDRLANSLLSVSTELLHVCQRDSSCIPDLLALSCSLFVNTFERHEDAVVAYITQHFPHVLQTWVDAAQYVLGRFAEEEDDLRQLLMHLFYLFADRLLPRRQRRRGGISAESSFYHTVPPTSMSDTTATTFTRAYEESEGVLGGENSRQLAQLIEQVFTVYLSVVVDKAHLREDSVELRFESGVNLHNERTLYPLAEMLYCDKVDFLPMMMARLRDAIDGFHVCAGARESALRSGGGGATTGADVFTEETTRRLTQILSSVDAATMQSLTLFTGSSSSGGGGGGGSADVASLFRGIHQSSLSLFLMRVCLSRLSVLISIFAIAIMRNQHDTSDEILLTIGGFAGSLLTEDDSLTNEMLQTLNVLDFSANGSSGGGGGGGNGVALPGAPPPPSSSVGLASPAPRPSLHIGILRSLFFFCNCVYESNFDRRPEFVDVLLDLLRFVYLYHSEEAALMMDANMLFKRVVTEGPTTSHLLSSDKLSALIRAVEEDAIPALQLPSPVQPPLPPAVRNGFFTAFTAFVETRFYAGYGVGSVICTLFDRALSAQQRLQPFTIQSLEEVVAISQGITQPDTLLIALDAAMSNRAVLVDHVMRADATAAAHVVRWLSALCRLSRRLLREDAASTTQWDWTSLVLNAMTNFFSLASTGAPAETSKSIYTTAANGSGEPGVGTVATKFYEFPVDAVDAEVVYDLAGILETLCVAGWSNLGVVAFYERATVERFFCGAVQLLTSVSPPLLMSSEHGRKAVFDAMITALTMEGQVFSNLHLLLMRQRVWQHVLDHLTRCLQYDYLPEVLQAMLLVVRYDDRSRVGVPNYLGIGERQLAAAFHEVAVLIAVAPFLEIRQLSYIFELLRTCYKLAREPCTDRVKALLGFCSAYHRVRLRTVWSMLVNGEPEMLDRYVSVFGQSSKVGVLSPW